MAKAALYLPSFQGNSIEQLLVVGNPQQEPAFSSRGQSVAQFVPGGLELRFRALVIRAVHARVLDQDVEAVYEGARRCRPVCVKCRRVVDMALLKPQLWL